MSIRNKRGLVAAMESVEDILPINDTQPTIDPEVNDPATDQEETVEIVFSDALDSPEAMDVDVEKAESDMVSVEEHIDDALDVINQVEQISDIVERGNENGGLDQTGAELLTATLNPLYERVGLVEEEGEQFVPSIESFGGTGSRIRAGNIALEDMKTRVKTIWQNIIKAIRVAIEKGKEFFKLLFDQTERYKARIVKLREIAAKVPKNVTATSFADPRLANALAIGNAVPDDLANHLNTLVNIGQAINGDINNTTMEACKKFYNLLKLSKSLTPEIFTSKLEEMGDDLAKIQMSNIFTDSSNENNITTFRTPVLLGNKKLGFDMDMDKTAKDINSIRKIKLRLIQESSEVKPGIKYIQLSSMDGVFDSANKILDIILDNRNLAKAKEDYKRNVQQAATSLEQAAGQSEEHKVMYDSLRSGLLWSVSIVDQFNKIYTRMALSAVASALTYAEKSLRAHVPQKEGDTPRLANA